MTDPRIEAAVKSLFVSFTAIINKNIRWQDCTLEVKKILFKLSKDALKEADKVDPLRNWQPIETAPKDGAPFLAISEGKPVIAYWRGGLNPYNGKISDFYYCYNKDGFEIADCGCRASKIEEDILYIQKWMPIPKGLEGGK